MNRNNTKKYIQNLNLYRIVDKLSSKDTEITHNSKQWSRKKSIEAVEQYKRYLWLIHQYQKKYKFLPPSAEIDFIWHAHILDTKAYAIDCKKMFGQTLHHDPYFGLNGKRDRLHLHRSFQNTLDLYEKEFNEPLYSLEDL